MKRDAAVEAASVPESEVRLELGIWLKKRLDTIARIRPPRR